MKHLVMTGVVAAMAAVTLGLEVEGFEPDEAVVYKAVGDVELKMHIFKPDGCKPSDKRPAIVLFFGGGWVSGNPSQFFPHCRHLASKGMVAMSAEYRVASRHKTTPVECVKDGKSAVRWVRTHASSYGIDPNRIAAGGGSAGGHVAAAAATVKGFVEAGEATAVSCRPNALVLFNPVYDNGPDGWGHAKVKDYWQDISPIENISDKTPPAIVFLGTKDKLIPVATAEKFKSLMQQEGVQSELCLYEGRGHGFFNHRGDMKDYNATVAQMDAFLASLGYIGDKPTAEDGS